MTGFKNILQQQNMTQCLQFISVILPPLLPLVLIFVTACLRQWSVSPRLVTAPYYLSNYYYSHSYALSYVCWVALYKVISCTCQANNS